ncbi:MAG: LPP20 family lipoprotein [Treponema sp.]|nr:LPP20 family lipoprotein [Treponema sp.]
MFRAKLFSLAKVGLPCLCLVLVLASCGTGSGAVATVPPRVPQPEWMSNLSGFMSARPTYMIAVGSGNSRQVAEMDALRQLVMTFGTDVQVDTRLVESYREVIRSGVVASWGDTALDRTIVLGAGMDNLIGAEISDFWTDGRGNHHALAVMNKARAIQVYSEMLRANLEIIANLTDMSVAERNTIAGFSRYQFAAVVADMSVSYGVVLSVLGAPHHAQGLRRGDDFRRQAQEIVRTIPIGINVRNDRAGRIQNAFAGAFSEFGFRTGGTNPRYLLDVNVVVHPTDHAGANVFARMELTANLIDTQTLSVLLPYGFNLREGHRTQLEAENRAFLVAEQRIAGEYRNMLSNHLFQLVPRR